MATKEDSSATVSESSIDIPLPEKREYPTQEDQELDISLQNAISAAEAAEEPQLAQLLRNELGSHYYKSCLGDD